MSSKLTRIRRCQRSVIDARFAYPYSTDPEAVNRRRQLKGALVSALECLRVCFEALQALQDEQDEQDELRVFLSNQRFMGYTTALLDRTREQILDAEHELGECRQWLRQHGESDPGTASPAADDQFGGLHVSLRQTGAQTMRAIPACTNSFDELYDVTPGQTQASRSAAASQQQAGNHAGQTVAKSPPKQRTKVPAAMAAGAPGQPDDDSSDSSDRREKPKRPHVDAHSPKRKRSADEGSSLDMRKGSRGGSSKFSKRSPTSAGHEADTGRTTERIDKWDLMLTLPEDVQMYYVQASEDGERLGLDQGDVLDMVLRLQAARGGDKDWIWPPISEILGPDGPKTGGAAMAVLERAERAEAVGAWNRFLDSISEDPGHEVYWDLYNDLRDHLALIESAMKPPTLPTDQAPAEIFNQWRRKVINIENPYIEAEWSAYIDHLEREGDAFKLESARNRYGNVMSRIAQGTEVCWPPKRPWTMLANAKSDGPPSGRRSTTPRYNTADFGRMATNIGFDTAKFGGRWTFLETAGTGAFGHAGLWVQYDSAARIIGRKIIKETYLKRRRDWDDAAVWLPPNLHKWPREAGIQGKLSMLAQAFNIVQLQTYKVYEEKRMYRLYMEYCEHSDLSTLITNHRALQLRGAVDQEGNPVQFHIPSMVVWCVFEALIAAAYLMRFGALPGDPEPKNWAEFGRFFHRDIKPANVFLAKPHDDVWKRIPIPKLGDFGLALGNPSFNVSLGKEYGTRGYMAPEALEYYDNLVLQARAPYSSASDLYSIGCTMVTLMNLSVPEQRDWKWESGPTLIHSADNFYPQKLRELVLECVRIVPEDRPSLQRLWQDIRREVAIGQGLRRTPIRLQELSDAEPFHCQPDKYVAWARN